MFRTHHHLTRALAALCAALACTTAQAGPPEGDLFGYKLGAPYAVGELTQQRTRVSPMVEMMIDRPDKAPDFKAIELLATPKSLTLISVHGVADFPDETQARAFAARQSTLIAVAYGDKCPKSPSFMNDLLKLLCPGGLELSVSYYPPDASRAQHKVHLGLRLAPDSEAGRRLSRLAEQESTAASTPPATPPAPDVDSAQRADKPKADMPATKQSPQ
jgi:hypothetical protein